jgi:hypothetical protein
MLIYFFRDLRDYPLVPKKFSLAIILEQNYDKILAETTIPYRYQYLTEEEFFQADLTFNGNFGNENMEVSPFLESFLLLSSPVHA